MWGLIQCAHIKHLEYAWHIALKTHNPPISSWFFVLSTFWFGKHTFVNSITSSLLLEMLVWGILVWYLVIVLIFLLGKIKSLNDVASPQRLFFFTLSFVAVLICLFYKKKKTFINLCQSLILKNLLVCETSKFGYHYSISGIPSIK